MVFTKSELLTWLNEKTKPVKMFDCEKIYNAFVEVLHWNDSEPRDIRGDDLELIEDFMSIELDRVLMSMENDILNSEQR